MGWSEYYESSFSQALHTCLTRLCSESLPVNDKVEIDGIVCINIINTDKRIVLKIHDVVDKSRSSSTSKNGKPSSRSSGFVPLGQRSVYDGGALSTVPQKGKQNIHEGQVIKNEMQYIPNVAKIKPQTCESDESLIELYKKETRYESTPPPPPLHKKPAQYHQQISPRPKFQQHARVQQRQQTSGNTSSGGSRRKQAKPQMVTQVPEDDDDESMSTGDMENWYSVESDSDNDPECSGLSSSMPSMSMLPYNQNHRPPRQRVPLTEELQTGMVVPSDFVCRKCNRKFQGFAQLQVHNMEVHRRYTCKQCQTTFSLRCNLRRHERLHEGHKPYQCQWCSKTFSRNGDLKIHEWKHREVAGKSSELGLKEESMLTEENGMDEEGIIVIEPTDVDDDESMSYSNDSLDARNESSPLDMSRKLEPPVFNTVDSNKSREGSPTVSLLSQNILKTVSKDSSSGGKVETVSDSQQMSDAIINSLYSKYIGNSPKSALLDLAQGYDSAPSPVSSMLSQNKSSKKSKIYPAVNEALKSWSSAPNSPASQGRNTSSPSPNPYPKSTDTSPKGSPKAEPVPRSQHYCLLCKEWWDDFNAYESHCAGVHGRYPCQYCGQTFSNKNNRARHGRSHTGQKQFSCAECGKSFTRSDILREHQIIHTESYHGDQCQYCGTKITTKKADLLAHIKKCIQLNKYSPSMIKAKMQAAAEGIETTLPLEYTPTKFLGNVSLLKQENTPSKFPGNMSKASPSKVQKGNKSNNLENPDRATSSPLLENAGYIDEAGLPEIVPSKTSPQPLVTNNNKGEKTPPKLPPNMVESGVVKTVPIKVKDE